MANDYSPRGDAEFNGWRANFDIYANANLAGLGLVAGDMTPVTTAQTTWNTKYPAHVAAAAAAIAAREGKDAARTGVEAAVRPLVRRLQASASVDDTERAALGITVPGKEPSPLGPPTTRPVVTVDASQRLPHTIDLTHESTPTRRAKPAGVIGANNVRVAWASRPRTGPPPVDPGELTFLAVDTRAPYTRDYDGPQGNKPAHYMLRWVNSRGEVGPWSATAMATIGG